MISKKKIKFIDLFAWIWWVRIGFEDSWFECVFSNDFDKNCKITFDKNFSHKWHEMFLEDISKIKVNDIPDFDLLCGGFPCQPFSVAWYRSWFNDIKWRWWLFFEIIRILKAKKPKAIFLENVKNLKTHDDGKTIQIIYKELEKLWYHIKDKVLNSMEYWNVPQNRERIYIVWFLNKESCDRFNFPEKIKLSKTIYDCLDKHVDEKYYYNKKALYEVLSKTIKRRDTVYQWRRKYVRENKNQVCPTLTANMWMWWHNVPLILDEKWIRKLTPKECSKFQGFPEYYVLPKISDSHLYKQLWNSVSVPVIKRISTLMLQSLT